MHDQPTNPNMGWQCPNCLSTWAPRIVACENCAAIAGLNKAPEAINSAFTNATTKTAVPYVADAWDAPDKKGKHEDLDKEIAILSMLVAVMPFRDMYRDHCAGIELPAVIARAFNMYEGRFDKLSDAWDALDRMVGYSSPHQDVADESGTGDHSHPATITLNSPRGVVRKCVVCHKVWDDDEEDDLILNCPRDNWILSDLHGVEVLLPGTQVVLPNDVLAVVQNVNTVDDGEEGGITMTDGTHWASSQVRMWSPPARARKESKIVPRPLPSMKKSKPKFKGQIDKGDH